MNSRRSRTDGQGVATLFYDTDLNQYDFILGASGLSAPVTVAHLHGLATPEQTAPPRVDILGPGFTVTASGNSLLVGGFDLPSPGAIPAGNGHPTLSFLEALQQGLVYANVHTSAFPAGEIRGQLLQVTAIPEPGTWALMALGLAAVGGMVARRRA